jgi:hypothetical protein
MHAYVFALGLKISLLPVFFKKWYILYKSFLLNNKILFIPPTPPYRRIFSNLSCDEFFGKGLFHNRGKAEQNNCFIISIIDRIPIQPRPEAMCGLECGPSHLLKRQSKQILQVMAVLSLGLQYCIMQALITLATVYMPTYHMRVFFCIDLQHDRTRPMVQ